MPSFPIKVYKSKYFTSKLSCFVVPQVGCSSLPVGPAGTLVLSAATCGDSTGEIKIGCDSVVGGDETLQVAGTPVSNSSESLPSVLVPTTEQATRTIRYARRHQYLTLRSTCATLFLFLSRKVEQEEIKIRFVALSSLVLKADKLFLFLGIVLLYVIYRDVQRRDWARREPGTRSGKPFSSRPLAFPLRTIAISALGLREKAEERIKGGI